MEWSKLKNIILLILLATNGFLLLLVGSREWSAAQNQSNARADAILVLEKNGISMDKDTLPKDLTLPLFSVVRDLDMEVESLTPLLGAVTPPPEDSSLYTGEKGNADLRGRGEFLISFAPDAYSAGTDLQAHAAATLARMGIEARAFQESGEEAGDREVLLAQTVEGVPVLPCVITATYRDGDLTGLGGTRLPGAPTPTGYTRELSAVTGLLRFLELLNDTGDVCSTVTVMTPAYQMTSGLADPVVLTPVWYFETDSGAYALDMNASELKRM